jgi:hypothetical protein
LGRDSATGRSDSDSAGFDANGVAVDMRGLLNQWQLAVDERLWKLIISPEFGERIDLPELTRGLMGEMSVQLRTDLEWASREFALILCAPRVRATRRCSHNNR